jgi:serine/threonine-protein kinase
MPFVEGETLRARLDREKQLRVEAAVGIATGVSYALAYAHERGIIHRDLKPENILFQAGQPVVADFGIALAVSNPAAFAPHRPGSRSASTYMSPEQAVGDRAIDARTDILAASVYSSQAAAAYGGACGRDHEVITDPARPVQIFARTFLRTSRPQSPKRSVPADRFETARAFSEALLNPRSQPRRLRSAAPKEWARRHPGSSPRCRVSRSRRWPRQVGHGADQRQHRPRARSRSRCRTHRPSWRRAEPALVISRMDRVVRWAQRARAAGAVPGASTS